MRAHAREVGIAEISAQGKYVRLSPVELPESAQLRLKRLYPGTILKPAIRAILVPAPMTAKVGGQPLTDAALLEWLEALLNVTTPLAVGAAQPV